MIQTLTVMGLAGGRSNDHGSKAALLNGSSDLDNVAKEEIISSFQTYRRDGTGRYAEAYQSAALAFTVVGPGSWEEATARTVGQSWIQAQGEFNRKWY